MANVVFDTIRAKIGHFFGDLDCNNLTVRGLFSGQLKPASYPPYANWFQGTPSPSTIANGGNGRITFGTITLLQPMTCRILVALTFTPGTGFQAMDLFADADSAHMTTGGHTTGQISSSTNGTNMELVSVGTVSLSAGTHTISAFCQVGGGGSSVTLSLAYGEIQGVAA